MIRKAFWMVLSVWLALGATPGLAAAPTATFNPAGTVVDGIVQCVYTAATKVETDGSISIACATTGTTGLKAKLSGTSGCTYAEADVDKDGAISIRCNDKIPQTISVSNVPATLGVGAKVTMSATASSGLPVTFSSTTPLRCTVSGSTVTAVSVGGCAIETIQAGNSIYSLKEDFQHFDIKVGAQTITFGSAPTVIVGETGSVSATASSGLPVTFSSTTPLRCTVSGSTVTGIAAGKCTLVANQAGDSSYSAAPQVNQDIIVTAAPIRKAQFATGGSSGCTYSSVIADENGFTITCSTKTGTPTATLIGTNGTDGCTYPTADVDKFGSLTILCSGEPKLAQAITFGTAPKVVVGGTGIVSATGGASGLPVIFSSLSMGVCTITGSNTVTGVAPSLCTIAADQAGNSNYSPALQSYLSFQITATTAQTIKFGSKPSPLITVRRPGTVTVTDFTGPVIFSSRPESICTVSGSTVSGSKVSATVSAKKDGLCIINATDDSRSVAEQKFCVGINVCLTPVLRLLSN